MLHGLHRILCQRAAGREAEGNQHVKVYTEIELPLVFTLDSWKNGESK